MLAILCPGQGSQTNSMLDSWLNFSEDIRSNVEKISKIFNLDLVYHDKNFSKVSNQSTLIIQSLVLTSNIVSIKALIQFLKKKFLLETNKIIKIFDVCLGHSLGELTAAYVSGILTENDSIIFLKKRAKIMEFLSNTLPKTGMLVLVGKNTKFIIHVVMRYKNLYLSGINYEGNVVVGGYYKDIENLKAYIKMKHFNISCFSLKQATGAFHTKYMLPSINILNRFLLDSKIKISNPFCNLISNKKGKLIDNGYQFIHQFINQMINPFRWDLCIETMKKIKVTGAIELPSNGVLKNLTKKSMPYLEVLQLKNPNDINKIFGFIKKHSNFFH